MLSVTSQTISSRICMCKCASTCTAPCIQCTSPRLHRHLAVCRAIRFSIWCIQCSRFPHRTAQSTHIISMKWQKGCRPLKADLYSIPSHVCDTDYYFLSHHIVLFLFCSAIPHSFFLGLLICYFASLCCLFPCCFCYAHFAWKEVQVR